MADLTSLISANILIIIIVLLVSALPLYFVVKLLGGHSTILKVFLVNFLAAGISLVLTVYVQSFVGLFSFMLTLIIYKIIFDLSLLRAFFAWILQYVIAVILIVLFIILIGKAV